MEGTLTINLEPPYIAFVRSARLPIVRHCSKDEVKKALIHLGASAERINELEDCCLVLKGDYSDSELSALGFAPVRKVS